MSLRPERRNDSETRAPCRFRNAVLWKPFSTPDVRGRRKRIMADGVKPKLTTAAGAPVANNVNSQTAGPRGPVLLQDVWLMEKLAQFDRELIPERRMHA